MALAKKMMGGGLAYVQDYTTKLYQAGSNSKLTVAQLVDYCELIESLASGIRLLLNDPRSEQADTLNLLFGREEEADE